MRAMVEHLVVTQTGTGLVVLGALTLAVPGLACPQRWPARDSGSAEKMADMFSYLDGIAEGRLILERCGRCKATKMISAMGVGPVEQPTCGACHSLEWERFEASGRAT